MKDVLIIGGAGNVGTELLKVFKDSKYSVTILDLESKLSKKRLQEVYNEMKIIYGDIEDYNLVKSLVLKNDIVINLAGIMPPLANLSDELAMGTNYNGNKNVVDAILEVNPSCYYIYTSFISIYGKTDATNNKLTVQGETNYPDDTYSVSLIRSEEYITSKLKKYMILRLPIVTTPNNYYIKHIKLGTKNDFITTSDLSKLIFKVLEEKKAYGHTYNISGFKATTDVLVKNMYKYSGYLNMFGRNIYYGDYDDADKINKFIDFKYENPSDYYKELKQNIKLIGRIWRKFINIPEYIYFKIKSK